MAGNVPKSRGMFQYVFKHLMDSFKVGKREKVGTIIGRDPYGNIYYELPAQPQLGKRRPTRWYSAAEATNDAKNKEVWTGFDSDLPSEWESWLRFRRNEAPTEEEVMQSLALAELKKLNAAKLEEKRRTEMQAAGIDSGPPKPQDHEKTPYPKYANYEVMPGESENETKDKWKKYKNPYMKE
ncbi:NADH dehydrogenase [ubiquinone] 1 alpha subcomplex assembly factor 2 [Eurytemora carolleeae]|uniref:NADH dehydrogenase [ubiquinone] 1 alpha subcomplex assembly factor 2 n=1 Tax=Eurytemora carolleeae TaxID=1294199 RepID=UPI000C7750A7|nr:NADH dehydrogenase [ubiquinone] 1 alpha subcomplex assembly factor 2 [Eurytemora carolleeae]|eukprot:XP_023341361.1 NADH dehydrogenase [ubiquinone] 1 alpha subcomplex assembly factor 2-like [Eurytemora affinis]